MERSLSSYYKLGWHGGVELPPLAQGYSHERSRQPATRGQGHLIVNKYNVECAGVWYCYWISYCINHLRAYKLGTVINKLLDLNFTQV